MHLSAGSPREHGDQKPDSSWAEDQRPVARREGGSLRSTLKSCAGSTAPSTESTESEGRVTTWPVRPAARPGARTAPAYANLLPVLADVLVAPSTPATGAVAEHGVAHHLATDPCRVHAVTDAGYCARPLMPEAHRIPRVSLVQVAISPVKNSTSVPQKTDPLHRRRPRRRPRPGPAFLHVSSGAVRTYARMVRVLIAAIISFTRSRSRLDSSTGLG